MGAVKEQSANLYATKMAERGFVTLSLDLSFWGESEGQPRNAVSPDIYAEDFSAAVDFLGTQAVRRQGTHRCHRDLRQRELRHQRGQDRPAHEGHRDRQHVRHGRGQPQWAQAFADPRAAKEVIAEAAEQRYVEFTGGETKYTSGTVHELTDNSDPIEREFYDFYRTPRGEFTPKGSSPNSPRTRR